jgi:hypothetical protein
MSHSTCSLPDGKSHEWTHQMNSKAAQLLSNYDVMNQLIQINARRTREVLFEGTNFFHSSAHESIKRLRWCHERRCFHFVMSSSERRAAFVLQNKHKQVKKFCCNSSLVWSLFRSTLGNQFLFLGTKPCPMTQHKQTRVEEEIDDSNLFTWMDIFSLLHVWDAKEFL